MNKEQFFKYLNDVKSMSEQQLATLDEVITENKYFFGARVLKLKATKELKLSGYEQMLKEVSALSPNRITLFFNLNPAQKLELSHDTSNQQQLEMADDVSAKTENESTFLLDESKEVSTVGQEPMDTNEQSEPTSQDDGTLLELSDSEKHQEQIAEGEQKHYIDPLLYTLEIPEDSLKEATLKPLTSHKKSKDNKKEEIVKTKKSDDAEPSQNEDQDALIEAFIESNPRIVPKQQPNDKVEEQEDISLKSIEEPEDAISEPLAKIHLEQGKKDKAITIYKKLSLKYPEKKAYFAAQIEKIKNQPDK